MDNGKQPTMEEVEAYVGTIGMHLTGQMSSHMIHLGDRLGLYQAMHGTGGITAAELADKTGLRERWLLEWLRAQSGAGLVTYEGDDRYALPPAAVPVLVDTQSMLYLAGFFHAPIPLSTLDKTAEAFRTGLGLSYEEQGPNCPCQMKRMTAPAHEMLPDVLAGIDGVVERLENGARVVDVGCSVGKSLQVLAAAYPNSTFEGVDPSKTAIGIAIEEAEAAGLSNLTFHTMGGEELPANGNYDLVLTLDCMHDLPYPQQVADAIGRSLHPDGVWLVKDITTSENFEDNLANPMAGLLYSISVLWCMSSALSLPNGAGLGTMGFNATIARQIAAAAGFTQFTELPVEADIFNTYYVVQR